MLDFFCVEANLAVEVDGAAHDIAAVAIKDEKRDRWLAEQNVRVLRFGARDILDDRKRLDALEVIIAAASAPSTALRAVPLPRL